jgi:hypothetical protein
MARKEESLEDLRKLGRTGKVAQTQLINDNSIKINILRHLLEAINIDYDLQKRSEHISQCKKSFGAAKVNRHFKYLMDGGFAVGGTTIQLTATGIDWLRSMRSENA